MNRLVRKFCTPPASAESDMDVRLMKDAEEIDFGLGGITLKGYSWGTGRNVLCVHGWGSRASHMAFIARFLSGNGYRVAAYDGPAHGRSLKPSGGNVSNFFEFCEAVREIAGRLEPLYAVVGHSMGASAAAFACTEHPGLGGGTMRPERLVLLSPLTGIRRMIGHFCRMNGMPDAERELTSLLELDFDFAVDDFRLGDYIRGVSQRLLIVHDEDDEEVPVSDALELKEAAPEAETLFTKGSGHQRILVNREVQRRIREFLA